MESVDDLVPFRKGNKWGIVHHDGKEFYKPVFDTIIPEGPYYRSAFTLFRYSESIGDGIKVVLKGKPMWLLSNKTLRPDQAKRETKEIDEGVTIEQKDIPPPIEEYRVSSSVNEKVEKPVVVRNYIIKYGVVRIEKYRDTFYVYLNDQIVPALTTNQMQFVSGYKEGLPIVMITNREGKKGIADLSLGKFTVPVEYDLLIYYNFSEIYATKNGLQGIIKADGSIVVPLKYKSLEIVNKKEDRVVNIASDDRGYFFLEIKGDQVTESKITYNYLVRPFSVQLIFIAVKDGLFGMVNEKDSVIAPLRYKELNRSQDPRFYWLTSREDLYGFLDVENAFLRVEPKFNSLGMAMPTNFTINKKTWYVFLVTKNGKSFYVDNFGKEFISK